MADALRSVQGGAMLQDAELMVRAFRDSGNTEETANREERLIKQHLIGEQRGANDRGKCQRRSPKQHRGDYQGSSCTVERPHVKERGKIGAQDEKQSGGNKCREHKISPGTLARQRTPGAT